MTTDLWDAGYEAATSWLEQTESDVSLDDLLDILYDSGLTPSGLFRRQEFENGAAAAWEDWWYW